MKDLRYKLAKAIGLEIFQSTDYGMTEEYDPNSKGDIFFSGQDEWGNDGWERVPDYERDLNAMAEVEKVIAFKSLREEYAAILCFVQCGSNPSNLTRRGLFEVLNAPANIRAQCALNVLENNQETK